MIVAMEWYAPAHPCKVSLNARAAAASDRGRNHLKLENRGEIVSILAGGLSRSTRLEASSVAPPGRAGEKSAENQPRLLIAYQNGNIQLMCDENSSSGRLN